MDNPNWFRPYNSEKECWLAAMADLYDGKNIEIRGFRTFPDNRDVRQYEWTTFDITESLKTHWLEFWTVPMRPTHIHRALIDLYWKYPGDSWMFLSKIGDEWIPCENRMGEKLEPMWEEHFFYEPDAPKSRELYAKYLKLVESGGGA